MVGIVIEEKELRSISKSMPQDAKVHCLIGKGMGGSLYSFGDLKYMGLWSQDIYEVDYGFKDDAGILIPHTEAEFTRRYLDHQWRLEYPQKPGKELMAKAGDFITLRPYHENHEHLSINRLTRKGNSTLEMELGSRQPKYLDTWKIIQGSNKGFSDKYLQPTLASLSKTATFFYRDPAHMTSPSGEMEFDIPGGVLDDKLNPRVVLTLSLTNVPWAQWLTSTAYVAGTTPSRVYNLVGGANNIYRCKSGHTSGASTEPGVGASWTTYWALEGVSDLDPGRTAITLSIDDENFNGGWIIGRSIGEDSAELEIDVTDKIVAGETQTIKIDVTLAQEVTTTHTDYKGHMQISASGTLDFYKRLAEVV